VTSRTNLLYRFIPTNILFLGMIAETNTIKIKIRGQNEDAREQEFRGFATKTYSEIHVAFASAAHSALESNTFMPAQL
jgi:hypothetical protein